MKSKLNKLYKSNGMWWSVDEAYSNILPAHVDGPYCADCYTDLEYPSEAYEIDFDGSHIFIEKWQGHLVCEACNKEHVVNNNGWELKKMVAKKFVSRTRASLPKESLDEPPTRIKVRDEDGKYFIAAKIGEKDGKRVGVVYFGEKNKEQNKKDYSQIFIDLDDEQVRFDKSNKLPKELLAKMKVDFLSSSHEAIYKKV